MSPRVPYKNVYNHSSNYYNNHYNITTIYRKIQLHYRPTLEQRRETLIKMYKIVSNLVDMATDNIL